MIQLGYASAILPDLSLEEVIQFTADNGFSKPECGFDHDAVGIVGDGIDGEHHAG